MKKYIVSIYIDGEWEEAENTLYEGDVYITIFDIWGEDFALEVMAWCEEANVGDEWPDDDELRIKVIEA